MSNYDDVKEELYPNNHSEMWSYGKEKKDKLVPSSSNVKSIKALLKSILGDSYTEEQLNDLIRSSYLKDQKDISLSKYEWIKEYKLNIIKGSIYKIKKYFLDSNNIKQIRGGSIIIDYLNDEAVLKVLNSNNLDEKNIIYCGGGNIFLAIPDVGQALGEKLCKDFEKYYTDVSLSAMNAFESIDCSLYDLLFNFSEISRKVNNKLEERKKIKLYALNNDSKLNGIEINKKYIKFSAPILERDEDRVCKYCDVNDAKYIIYNKDEEDTYLCPSCLRKHKVGKEAKSKFVQEYESVKSRIKYEPFNSVDDFKDDIAVIYGDGNNMGQIVMNVKNVYEMMYFSEKTDKAAKDSVYSSIDEIAKKYNKDKVMFEVIALGGDDIFIIIPAMNSLEVCSHIIKTFDQTFNNKITMSMGVVISKASTPISSTFDIAQRKLKNAKKLVKKEEVKEGSIDVIELIGNFHVKESSAKSEFPMSVSKLNKFIEVINSAKEKNVRLNTQLNKLNYAQHNMENEEFDLFFLYQKSKCKGYGVHNLIENLYGKNDKEKIYEPHKINWDDILLLWKRI
ncbi:MAG: hypothetical protein E7214_10740 [Clostridium sp.]|nr:hypothetical protein [Clostridium sp.]